MSTSCIKKLETKKIISLRRPLFFSRDLNFAKEEAQCSITALEIEKIVVLSLTAENKKEARRKEKEDDVQKESTLQPITKANTKLERELQEWEVESTKGGANGGGG